MTVPENVSIGDDVASLVQQLQQLTDDVRTAISTYRSTSYKQQDELAILQATIRQQLTAVRAALRDLDLTAEEQDTDEQAQAVSQRLSQYKRLYDQLQQDYKAAAVALQRQAATAAVEERRQLLGTAEGRKKHAAIKSEADVLAVADDITSSLRRTRQVLTQELEQTSATFAVLEESNRRLAAARDELAGQTRLYKAAKGLLKTMNLHAVFDWLVLWGGVAFFCLVVIYIVQKRVRYFIPSAMLPSSLWGGSGKMEEVAVDYVDYDVGMDEVPLPPLTPEQLLEYSGQEEDAYTAGSGSVPGAGSAGSAHEQPLDESLEVWPAAPEADDAAEDEVQQQGSVELQQEPSAEGRDERAEGGGRMVGEGAGAPGQQGEQRDGWTDEWTDAWHDEGDEALHWYDDEDQPFTQQEGQHGDADGQADRPDGPGQGHEQANGQQAARVDPLDSWEVAPDEAAQASSHDEQHAVPGADGSDSLLVGNMSLEAARQEYSTTQQHGQSEAEAEHGAEAAPAAVGTDDQNVTTAGASNASQAWEDEAVSSDGGSAVGAAAVHHDGAGAPAASGAAHSSDMGNPDGFQANTSVSGSAVVENTHTAHRSRAEHYHVEAGPAAADNSTGDVDVAAEKQAVRVGQLHSEQPHQQAELGSVSGSSSSTAGTASHNDAEHWAAEQDPVNVTDEQNAGIAQHADAAHVGVNHTVSYSAEVDAGTAAAVDLGQQASVNGSEPGGQQGAERPNQEAAVAYLEDQVSGGDSSTTAGSVDEDGAAAGEGVNGDEAQEVGGVSAAGETAAGEGGWLAQRASRAHASVPSTEQQQQHNVQDTPVAGDSADDEVQNVEAEELHGAPHGDGLGGLEPDAGGSITDDTSAGNLHGSAAEYGYEDLEDSSEQSGSQQDPAATKAQAEATAAASRADTADLEQQREAYDYLGQYYQYDEQPVVLEPAAELTYEDGYTGEADFAAAQDASAAVSDGAAAAQEGAGDVLSEDAAGQGTPPSEAEASSASTVQAAQADSSKWEALKKQPAGGGEGATAQEALDPEDMEQQVNAAIERLLRGVLDDVNAQDAVDDLQFDMAAAYEAGGIVDAGMAQGQNAQEVESMHGVLPLAHADTTMQQENISGHQSAPTTPTWQSSPRASHTQAASGPDEGADEGAVHDEL